MRKQTIRDLETIAARYPSVSAADLCDIDISPAEAVEVLDALRAAGYTDIPVQPDPRQMTLSPRADVCRCMHGHVLGGDCPECP